MTDQLAMTMNPCRECGAEVPYRGYGRPRTICEACSPPHTRGTA
jgi:hypothetical protein